MAKYTWLKQNKDFYKTKMMRFLQRQEDGLELIFIYQNMMLISLENDGKIVYEEFEDSLAEEIFYEIDSPLISVEGVQRLIDLLTKKHLLEQDGDEYLLVEVLNMIGSDNSNAERQRRYRSNKKEKASSNEKQSNVTPSYPVTDSNNSVTDQNVTSNTTVTPALHQDVTHRNAVTSVTPALQKRNREKEIEKEKDKEKEGEKEKKKKIPPLSDLAREVILFINELTGKRMNPDLPSHQKPIISRLKEGYTVSDLEAVAEYLYTRKWKTMENKLDYCIPTSMFRKEKFPINLEAARSSPPVSADHIVLVERDFGDLSGINDEDLPF